MPKKLLPPQPPPLTASMPPVNTPSNDDMQVQIAQLQQALKFESTLRCLIEKIRDSLEEGVILQTAVRELALVLEASCCNITLYDLGQESVVAWYEHPTAIASCQDRMLSLSHYSEIHHQLRQGTSVQFCSRTLSFRGQVVLFACPLVKDEEWFGDLWVIRETARVLTEAEANLVQQVANQCAIAIHQARLYQAAQKQVDDLKQINQRKDDFLTTVSHELRAPMANMRIAIQIMERFFAEGRAICGPVAMQNSACSKSYTYLQILQAECEREIALVDDLLDLHRIEDGQQPLSLEPIDLPTFLADLVQPFRERLRQRELTLKQTIAPDLPLLESDPATLKRILSELLHNACKYTPPSETIALTVLARAGQLHIQVCNSGVEIDLEQIPHIFDKFYRIPGGDRWKQGGTGLGLALVQKLVALLGGTIQVKSGNQKTCFSVNLPLA